MIRCNQGDNLPTDLSEWMELLAKFLPAILGFAGAWAGSRWGLDKFKKEKHWEEKVKTYKSIIAAVESIAFWGKYIYADTLSCSTLGQTKGESTGNLHTFMRLITQLRFTADVYLSSQFKEIVLQFEESVTKEYGNHANKMYRDGNEEYYCFGETANQISYIAYIHLEPMITQAQVDIGLNQQSIWKRLTVSLKNWYGRASSFDINKRP